MEPTRNLDALIVEMSANADNEHLPGDVRAALDQAAQVLDRLGAAAREAESAAAQHVHYLSPDLSDEVRHDLESVQEGLDRDAERLGSLVGVPEPRRVTWEAGEGVKDSGDGVAPRAGQVMPPVPGAVRQVVDHGQDDLGSDGALNLKFDGTRAVHDSVDGGAPRAGQVMPHGPKAGKLMRQPASAAEIEALPTRAADTGVGE